MQPSSDIAWSTSSIFGALLGYALHISMSLSEWKKISKQPDLTFKCFILNDVPSQVSGVILVIFSYCSLTAVTQVDWLKDTLGFSPKLDFFSAFMTAFTSQSIGVKLANILRKLNGSP